MRPAPEISARHSQKQVECNGEHGVDADKDKNIKQVALRDQYRQRMINSEKAMNLAL